MKIRSFLKWRHCKKCSVCVTTEAVLDGRFKSSQVKFFINFPIKSGKTRLYELNKI